MLEKNEFYKLHKDLSKDELLELLDKSNNKEIELNTKIQNIQVKRSSNVKRIHELENVMKEKPMTINELAEKLNTNNKNISSIFCGMKKENIKVATDFEGKKFLWCHDYNRKDDENKDIKYKDITSIK